MRKTTAVALTLVFAPSILAAQLANTASAQSVGGRPALPPKSQCTVSVSYPQGRPDLVAIAFPGGGCEDDDVALAVALTAILKSAMAQPLCTDKNPLVDFPCYDAVKR
jgi:hypothetical protein